MSEELSINVNIAGRPYKLSINREDEEKIRIAAKNINEKVKRIQEHFAVKDKQDPLAMAALEICTEAAENVEVVESEAWKAELEAISDKLDAYLNS